MSDTPIPIVVRCVHCPANMIDIKLAASQARVLEQDATIAELRGRLEESEKAGVLLSAANCGLCERLEVAEKFRALVERAVEILQRNAPPDGLSNHDAISELLGVFDGPDYRAAIAKEQP